MSGVGGHPASGRARRSRDLGAISARFLGSAGCLSSRSRPASARANPGDEYCPRNLPSPYPTRFLWLRLAAAWLRGGSARLVGVNREPGNGPQSTAFEQASRARTRDATAPDALVNLVSVVDDRGTCVIKECGARTRPRIPTWYLRRRHGSIRMRDLVRPGVGTGEGQTPASVTVRRLGVGGVAAIAAAASGRARVEHRLGDGPQGGRGRCRDLVGGASIIPPRRSAWLAGA